MRELRIISLLASVVIIANLPFLSASEVGPHLEVASAPVQLRIPSIGVNAQIQQVGITPSGAMGIPTSYDDVGWYKYGVTPGMLGSAVFAGHFDGKETPRAVFYDLSKLKEGDVVEVLDKDGNILKFKVVETKIYDYASSTEEIFKGDLSKARLNLITCSGDWVKASKRYNKRIVVFTEFVE